MGDVVKLPSSRTAEAVQLSAYPQDDGTALYCVEVLYSDDTWDCSAHTTDRAEGWKLAGREAISRNAPLLPVSSFPGRAA